MRNAARLLVAALLLASGLVAAGDGQDPRRWLDRMVEAARTLNYEGTFVYRSGTVVESMRILHRHDENGERERLVSLDGVAREVIRDNEQVTCILPDSDAVLVGKRRLRGVNAGPLFAVGEVPAQYRVEFAGKDRIAGRKAARLDVVPADSSRYGYQLWIDHDTGLLLRSALVAPGNEVLEEIAYTSLTVPAHIPDELLEPTIEGRRIRRYDASRPSPSAALADGSAWQVDELPAGFVLREHVISSIPDSEIPVEHLVYSDGLASLSVFIERLVSQAEAFEGGSSMGAVSAYGRLLGEHQVTVVGEVPMPTVVLVGRSVRRR